MNMYFVLLASATVLLCNLYFIFPSAINFLKSLPTDSSSAEKEKSFTFK